MNAVHPRELAPHPHADAVTGTAPAIEVLSADKTYPDGTQALLPVDLAVAEGEFVTLLGPVGLRQEHAAEDDRGHARSRPTAGCCCGAGRCRSSPRAAGKLAFVFQSPTLMPWAGVQANVRLPLDLRRRRARRGRCARRRGARARRPLDASRRALPRTLSGGMQMRVSIARALVDAIRTCC